MSNSTESEVTPASPPSGELIHLLSLASGGMGRVDLVMRRGRGFERLYVTKRLHPTLRDDAACRAMFVDEGRLAGLIRHANVVSVLDVGEDDEGPFLLMDYVDGVTLATLIAQHVGHAKLIPLQVCVRLCAQIADGLHAAHELTTGDGRKLELVHRDVSPQNVLVGYDGVCRVTDFGIAKALGQSSKTATGMFKGKLGYMAPEVLRFEKLDRRSDLFSLGIVLYELVTTQRLYVSRDDGDGPRRILTEAPPDLGVERADVPPELVELSFELLAKDRDARPKSAYEVARRLEAIAATLASDEGPNDLAEYVQVSCASVREAQNGRIAEAITKSTTATPRGRASPRPRSRIGAASFILGSLAVAGAIWAVRGRAPTRDSAPTAPLAEPPVARDAAAATVTLRITSEPAGASVELGGAPRGPTPVSIVLDRDSRPVHVRLAADDHLPIERDVVPDVDRELHVALVAAPPVVVPSTRLVERPRAPRPGRRPPAPQVATKPSADPAPPPKPRFERF